MPRYFDLDVDFWFDGLSGYSRSIGFEKVCCFAHPHELNGVEIKARRPEDLRVSGDGKVTMVSSSNVDLLIEATKKREIDMLLLQEFTPSVALIRAAHERGKAFEVPLGPFITSSGVPRAILMSKARFFLRLCLKYGAGFAMTSGAHTKYLMRAPREMVAIGGLLGLTRDQASASISAIPLAILENKNLL